MSRTSALLTFAGMTAFFGCFFVYPIWTTVQVAFLTPDHRFTFEFIFEVFRNTLYLEGLANSLIIAAWTTFGCALISLPLAMLYVRYDYPGKTLLNSLALTPLVLPPFVGAIGIKAILGQAGAFNSALISLGLMDAGKPVDWFGEGQMTGIVIMEVLHLYPILYLNIAAALARLDPAMEEAAANLGSPPIVRFWRITLPLIMPGLFAGGTLVFIWSFTELGVPLVFDFDRVTAVQIFRSLNDLSENPFPYALVVVLLIVSTLLYTLSRVFFGSSLAMDSSRAATAREARRLPLFGSLLCIAAFAAVTFVAIIPHAGVVLLSFAGDWYNSLLPNAWTLDHYHGALGHELTLSSIANSLKYSGFALVVCLLLGVSVAYINVRTRIPGRQLLDTMAMLPLAVPGVVIAFGYLAMTRPGQPFDWLIAGEDPVLILVIAYAVRRVPYVVRSATAGLQQISPVLEEAAQSLGATPERTMKRITLPLVMPHLIAGALLAFAFSMLEVSDSMILAQQAAHFPITKAIYTLILGLANGPNLAAALGAWAMLFLTITLISAAVLLGRKLGAMFR
ncbi:MAG TPA: iron ABC transporter permease [Prosthecobacter sp.]|nr:iron ABC transporter permease [Prosthecobacter sp.]